MENIKMGDFVKFYHCDRANEDMDYSGIERYWVIGKVINRRITNILRLPYLGIELGGDDVVDIELPDGRISNGHFTKGVELCTQ